VPSIHDEEGRKQIEASFAMGRSLEAFQFRAASRNRRLQRHMRMASLRCDYPLRPTLPAMNHTALRSSATEQTVK
jgi:hypothetical protein